MTENPIETPPENETLPVTPETHFVDERAIRTLLLYDRGFSILQICLTLNISRSTAFRDLKRAREILEINPVDILPQMLRVSQDLMREAWTNYMAIDKMTDTEGRPLPEHIRNNIKLQHLAEINKFLAVRGKIMLGGSRTEATLTQIPTQQGSAVKIELKREQGIPALQRLAELKAKGIIKGE